MANTHWRPRCRQSNASVIEILASNYIPFFFLCLLLPCISQRVQRTNNGTQTKARVRCSAHTIEHTIFDIAAAAWGFYPTWLLSCHSPYCLTGDGIKGFLLNLGCCGCKPKHTAFKSIQAPNKYMIKDHEHRWCQKELDYPLCWVLTEKSVSVDSFSFADCLSCEPACCTYHSWFHFLLDQQTRWIWVWNHVMALLKPRR